MKAIKPKKCRVCKLLYQPYSTTAVVCSPRCAISLNDQRKVKKEKIAEKAVRKQQKEAKIRIKTKSDWMKEAQVEFNKYIRLRDSGQVCISCQKPAKKANAGHFKTTKAYPELRFNEDGCHLQCEHCNTYLSGNIAAYRINLIKKIGLDKVEWLEGKHPPAKLTIDDIMAIKVHYRNKAKGLQLQ